MLTECPSCSTVFRVTGAILKMGHGQVRCGKCRKQFDAIECMLDEDTVEEEDASVPSTQQPQAAAPEDEDDDFGSSTYAEEVTMEGSRIEISGTYRQLDNGALEEKIVREHVVIDRDDLPSINTHGPENDADREPDDNDEIVDEVDVVEEIEVNDDDDEPVAVAADHLLDDPPIESRRSSTGSGQAPAFPNRWRRALHVGRKKEHEEIHAELHALTSADQPRVLRTGVWSTVCVVFGVLLVVQIVHHNRDKLVRDPTFGNTVSRLYRAVGLSPTPHWNLDAYKWEVYRVATDPNTPNALRVVGSVSNNAAFAQPYPLGKLILTDRWEAAVGERAFKPSEYLRTPEGADRLMAPKQRTSIEIVIADPGPDAVGHDIDACLEQDSRLTCANDLRTRR